MKSLFTTHRTVCLLAVVSSLCFTGCFGLFKPAHPVARHFVLTPITNEPPSQISGALIIGINRVRIAPYLFDTSFAIRRGHNEIDYSSQALWAERLDNGIQRVLASNLAALLPTDKIRLTAWRSEDVSIEVHVAIEQFDVDADGRGVLIAWWRLLAPGGEKTVMDGNFRLSQDGPTPEKDPAGSVATLSQLAADFSRRLAQAIKEATTGPAPTPVIR